MELHRDAWVEVANAAERRARSWLSTVEVEPTAGLAKVDAPAAQGRDLLEEVRRDSDGLAFTTRLLEALLGDSDPFSSALNLQKISRDLPQTLPTGERLAVRAGGLASLGLPWAVLPVVRKWLRGKMAHLVATAKIPVEQGDLPGGELILALGGDAVLGDRGATREIDRLIALAQQPEVTALAVDVARIVPQSTAGAWSLDADVASGAAVLRRLFAEAGDTLIVLESHSYRDALLAPQLLVDALEDGAYDRVAAGIALPTELPESRRTAEALAQLAQARVARGAQPLEIVLGSAAMHSREQIDSILTGLPVTTLDTETERTAHLLRMLSTLLSRGEGVRVTVASEDALLLAAATHLAEAAGRADALQLQLRAGAVPALESAIAEHGHRVRRRLPLTTPAEFDGAVDYLIALAAEGADEDSVLAHARSLLAGELWGLELGTARLREAIDLLQQPAPESRRLQRRPAEWSEEARDTASFYRPPSETALLDTGGLTAAVLGLTRAHTGAIALEPIGAPVRVPVVSATGFANEADTDATRFENRVWVRDIVARAASSEVGYPEMQQALSAAASPDEVVDAALVMAEAWSSQRSSERGTRIGRLAFATASARDRLLEAQIAESGSPVYALDTEVNTAIDAARYLGQLAGGLSAVRGATFDPDRLTLIVAGAGTPLGERAEAVLAALAAGSAVVLVAHPTIARSSAVLIDEWRAAGLPEGVVSLVVGVDEVSGHFAADERVDRALVLGRRSLAETLLRRRPSLRIEGRFRATGAVAITPSADVGLAVRHAVASAFGGVPADARAAHALVLLGPAARSKALKKQLADAVRSLPAGSSAAGGAVGAGGAGAYAGADGVDPLTFAVGPLPEVPDEAGLRALTELGPGEEWLVQPQRLDSAGLLWSPGVRLGVPRDATFWEDAIGMPVLGVTAVHSVDELIAVTGQLSGGGAAALHSNEQSEIVPWLERVRAASLVVGRATTGARIERLPGGGWGRAGMGIAPLAGGPDRLVTLGSWQLREGTASSTLHLRGLKPEVAVLIEAMQPHLDYQHFDRVRRAALADALAWRTKLGTVRDVSGLGVERNVLRRWPVPTHVRLAEDGMVADLVRVLAAALLVEAPITLSTGVVLPPVLSDFLARQGLSVSLERDDDWLERVSVNGPGDAFASASRVRLIGGDRSRTAEWLGGLGEITLWAEPVTMAGPVELLAFLREQSVSITAHRHGLALLPPGVGDWLTELQALV